MFDHARKGFLAGALLVAATLLPAGAASAADAGGVTSSDWSGGYLGVHFGGGWGDSDWAPSPVAHSVNGFLGGIQGGFNVQSGNMVYGIEGDLSLTNADGASACPNPAFACSTEYNYLASVRGRIGVASGSMLFYGTGGFTWADVDLAATPAAGGFNQSETLVGGVFGGGVAIRFSDMMSGRAEVLHYIFNDPVIQGGPGVLDTHITSARVGIDWHWQH